MVATYVEIVYGVRLTDREASRIFLGFNDEQYDKIYQEEGFVFNLYSQDQWTLDLEKFWKNDLKVFSCSCCSDTTDVIVGISLRTIYRVKTSCDNCQKYWSCNTCFNTTEQGIIDYEKTYSFASTIPNQDVCNRCFSWNSEENNETCKTCGYDMVPYNGVYTKKRIIFQDVFRLQKEPALFFHWNDCGSCS